MLIVNLLGLLLVALIVWWFWLYKPGLVHAEKNAVTVVVDNGSYQPSRIRIVAGKAATLRFLRKDASPCAATVVFADLDIAEELPLDQPKAIELPPLAVGDYPFTCQMQMYRGELVVSDDEN